MFNRTREVYRNKNKLDKALKARRRNEMLNLKNKSAFKAKLYDELKYIEVILQDNDIEAVQVTVPDKVLPQFSTAIYSEDLASYDITQVEGKSNVFEIRRKFVAF